MEDVVAYLRSWELSNVVLVGHSYGGLITTGAADRLEGSGTIGRMVYLDAAVPEDGDGWYSFNKPEAAEARRRAAEAAGGLFLPAPDASVFGLTDPEDRDWVARRLCPHPFGCYLTRLSLPNLAQGKGAASHPRTYIDCVDPFYSDFNGLKPRLKSDSAWRYVEIGTGHDAMVSAPEEVARILTAE